jgi:hypothetical protein
MSREDRWHGGYRVDAPIKGHAEEKRRDEC